MEQEFFALLDARDRTIVARDKFKRDGFEAFEAQAAAVTRALALEAARAVAPDRFVQVTQQLETLERQFNERSHALSEFCRRFEDALNAIRENHRTEIEAALNARIAKLEEQKKLPGAPVEAIEAEIARLKRELACLPTASAARTKPKSKSKRPAGRTGSRKSK